MRGIKFRVFFYDGIDKKTGEYISAEEAFSKDYIRFNGNNITPTDKCSIIEQFTGIHDCNGKEIYEGDILKITALLNDHNQRGATSIMQICIDEGCVRLKETNTIISLSFRVGHSIEIIGNIHESIEVIHE